jgi:hypothetical protein
MNDSTEELSPQAESPKTYVMAVQANDGTYRIVFEADDGYAVYKGFADSDVWTAKYWAVEDLDKTASYWSTKTPFEPTDEQVATALSRIKHAAGKMARVGTVDNETPSDTESVIEQLKKA